jgi:hypothetical protein
MDGKNSKIGSYNASSDAPSFKPTPDSLKPAACPQEYDADSIDWHNGSSRGCAHFVTFWTSTDCLDVF